MITLSIQDADRSNDIERDTLVFTQGRANRLSSLTFRMKGKPGRAIPELGDVARLFEDGEPLFKGTVTERSEWIVNGLLVGYEFNCQDGRHNFDRRLVAKAFQDVDSHLIAASIVGNYASGFTLESEGEPVEIETMRFNYEQPSRCMDMLCAAIGFDWFIDANDVVHFFPRGSKVAPFDIEEGENANYKSVEFDRNIVELKNAVYVRGGFYLDEIAEADSIDKYVADGEQRSFPLVFRYKQIQAKLNNDTLAIGIQFIDNEEEFDALYNYQQKALVFPEASKPEAGDVLAVFGDAEVPLVIRVQDNDSISQYGLVEGIRIDNTITSVAEAELVGNQTLAEWSEGAYEGRFVTREKGLRGGQAININIPSRGVDDTFVINRIVGRVIGDQFEYTVSFLKSGNITFTDMMVELMGRERKNLVLSNDDVVLRFLEENDDPFSFTDEVVEIATDSPPYTWGEGSTNPGKWGFATWS